MGISAPGQVENRVCYRNRLSGACQGVKMLSEDDLDFASLPGELCFSPADARAQRPDACHSRHLINPQLTQTGSTAGSERQFGQGVLRNGLKHRVIRITQVINLVGDIQTSELTKQGHHCLLAPDETTPSVPTHERRYL